MTRGWLLLVALAFTGSRPSVGRRTGQVELIEADAESKVENTDERLAHTPLFAGFVHNQYTQQFEVKEDNKAGMSWFKKYKFELEQYETKDWVGRKHEIDIERKIPMKVEPNIMTVHGRMDVSIGGQEFDLVKAHMTGANPFGHYSWRVVPKGDDNNVLFTIQKRKWNDHCKFGIFKCKAVWKIYEGHRGDKSGLIYYGVGDADDQDEPDFKFYHNEAEYKNNKKHWVAKIEHKKHDDSDGEDKYKVKVRPNEDAALLLLAVACLDNVADGVRHDD